MPIVGWAEFREPKGEGQPYLKGQQRFERGGARWGEWEGTFLEETAGPKGPDRGGAQLSLGRGWQGPHSRGSSETGHRRLTGLNYGYPQGWQLGWTLYLPDFIPHHLCTFFLHSFVHSTCIHPVLPSGQGQGVRSSVDLPAAIVLSNS